MRDSAMSRLYSFLECAYDGKAKRVPVASIHELEDAYNRIVRTGSAETINSAVRDICSTAGLTVKDHGIGWIISK